MVIIAIAIISIILFISSVRQEKRRSANIGLFLLACGFTAWSLEWLGGGGWLYTYLLSYIFILFAVSSIIFSLVCLVAGKEMYDQKRPPKTVSLYLGAGVLAWILIPFFYYTAGGPLFTGIWDAILHLPLFFAIYLTLSFAALVIYTILTHITPTRRKWDYLLIADTLTPDGRMTARLRQRLDLVRGLYDGVRGKTRIILPNIETAITARDYLADRGIDPEDITALDAAAESLRARLSALADTPCSVKPYHVGLIITTDYLACRTAHELRLLGLRGKIRGCQTTPVRWAVRILGEYQTMLWVHSRAAGAIIIFWLILCGLSLWW